MTQDEDELAAARLCIQRVQDEELKDVLAKAQKAMSEASQRINGANRALRRAQRDKSARMEAIVRSNPTTVALETTFSTIDRIFERNTTMSLSEEKRSNIRDQLDRLENTIARMKQALREADLDNEAFEGWMTNLRTKVEDVGQAGR